MILLVEDLHWLDATTLLWLERLIDQAATAPLLLVMTIRPNTLDIPWGSRARVIADRARRAQHARRPSS